MLRRLLLLPLLIIAFASAYAQEFQRMVISMADLNGMVVEAGSSAGLIANCLDLTRKVPMQQTSMNHILDGSQDTYVEYLHTGKKVPLASLLGKENGVSITGTRESDIIANNKQRNAAFWSGAGDNGGHFTLHLQNHTGQPIRLISGKDIQLGEAKESAVNTLGGKTGNEIWLNTSLKRLKDMGYVSNTDLESQLAELSEATKANMLHDATADFETKNHLPVTGSLETPETEHKFNEIYNKMLAEHARVDNERMDFIKRHDVGFSGDNAHDYKKAYQDAHNITEDLSWEKFNASLKSDHDHHIIYKKIEGAESYTQYITSSRIPGLLYTPSRDLLENYEMTEGRLFDQQMDHEDFFVVNLLDPKRSENASTFDAVKSYFPDRHANFQLSELAKLEKMIKNRKVKYVWILGHYDDGYLYVSAGRDQSRIAVSDLYALGNRLGVKIVPLGCNSSISAGGRAGTLAEVNSVDVLRQLFASTSGNKNYGTFLQHDEQTGLPQLHVFEKGGSEREAPHTGEPVPGETYSYTQHQLFITFPVFLAAAAILNPNHKNDDKQHGKH
jgi:hypothetical protein